MVIKKYLPTRINQPTLFSFWAPGAINEFYGCLCSDLCIYLLAYWIPDSRMWKINEKVWRRIQIRFRREAWQSFTVGKLIKCRGLANFAFPTRHSEVLMKWSKISLIIIKQIPIATNCNATDGKWGWILSTVVLTFKW